MEKENEKEEEGEEENEGEEAAEEEEREEENEGEEVAEEEEGELHRVGTRTSFNSLRTISQYSPSINAKNNLKQLLLISLGSVEPNCYLQIM